MLEILLSGTVGLLVIAAVAMLLKVEELAPLRNRIAGLVRRILRRGSPNPGAASGVKDTGGGTLAGDTYSAADVANAEQGRQLSSRQQRTMAATTVIDLPTFPYPSSREQVANPVPNDSGGPAVRGAGRDTETDE